MNFKDEEIAAKYLSKRTLALNKGIEFNLSLISFINICKAKRCYYTGVKLTKSTLTLDRVDNSLGYIKGNVVACSKAFNTIKSIAEDNGNPFTSRNILKGVSKMVKIEKTKGLSSCTNI